jgi:hypothetical protein
MNLEGIYGLICVIISLIILSSPLFISLFDNYVQNKKKEKIILIKFDIYIVGYPSGEILYVDKKRINRLKEKKLIEWDNEISRYTFKDKNIERIKKLINPLIMIYYKQN